MLKSIQYRGPDGTDYVFSNKYAFGTNRLAIQSIKFGFQPIENKRYILGFNGEIFNFFDLKKLFNYEVKSEVELILGLFK